MRLFGKLFTGGLAVLASCSLFAAGKASHIVVVVWDGMRPDFVSPETTPTLSKLAQQGVVFRHHHSVYPSSTEVNGAALATGDYPAESSIIGNNEYRPELNAFTKIMTADPAAIRKADTLTSGHFLPVPTLAEVLHSHGLHTAVAGAKTVALLPDRGAGLQSELGVSVFEGRILPEKLSTNLIAALGKFPPSGPTKADRDLWTTRALLEPLWENGTPPFSLLWLSEPDASQHRTGPGSPTSLEAIKSSDANLSRIVSALQEKHLEDKTDVFLVSDHAFSTIVQTVNVLEVLCNAGFAVTTNFAAAGPRDGEVLLVSNGGSVFFYVPGHARALVERLVHFLQQQPFCGALFTRQRVEGAFSLETVKLNSPSAPDVVLSMRWSSDKNTNGVAGLLYSGPTEYAPGQGNHSSLSPFDLHNTCIAWGPDFAKGISDDLPTGNIDLAPTIMWILGIKRPSRTSGRVLAEALPSATGPVEKVKTNHLEATYYGTNFTWRQYLDYSEVNGVRYLDQAYGQSRSPAKP